jgi:hypothetical protein
MHCVIQVSEADYHLSAFLVRMNSEEGSPGSPWTMADPKNKASQFSSILSSLMHKPDKKCIHFHMLVHVEIEITRECSSMIAMTTMLVNWHCL